MSAVPLPPWWGVALSVVLVVVGGLLVARERLGLGRDMTVASVRAAVQLIAVGAALKLLFEHTGLPGSLAWVTGMVLLAGRVAGGRAPGLRHATAIATASLGVGIVSTLGVLLGAQIIEDEPRVVVPIGGMIVTAAMQGVTLVLTRVRDEALSQRSLVEARLVLGLPGTAAFAPHERLALRSALIPGIDQTKVVGLISLPGAMTGLIIAGVSPVDAIRYQIVVMYMWLGACAISGVTAARLARGQLFDDAHRLRPIVVPPRRRGIMRV